MKNISFYIKTVILAIISSIVNFYATNLILSDISNIAYNSLSIDFISSLPALFFAINLVIFSIYFSKQNKKELTIKYTTIIAILSALGILSSFLTGIIVYKSFFVPYPFYGYSILGVLIHSISFIIAVYINTKTRKEFKPLKKRSFSFKRALCNFFLLLLVYFSFNRFGAFLLSFSYIQWRTLDLTFPFYLSLLLPIALLNHIMVFLQSSTKIKHKSSLINIMIITILSFILNIAIMIIGTSNTLFVSAISPAVGIERLITIPVDIILQTLITISFSIYLLIRTIKDKKEA